MKKGFITAMLVCLLPYAAGAENRSKVETCELQPVMEVQMQILDELKTMREFQEDMSNKREQAVRERCRRDSLQKKVPARDLTTDYGVMAQIEDNTRQDIVKDGWNLYGCLAFIVAVFSMGISIFTYRAQKQTEGNTKKLSQDAQRKLLNELLRHLYRNYVITYTMRTKMEDIDYAGHPSEEHFEKLKIPMENIHLDVFYGEDEKFRLMHVLYLNLRNYNEEVEVALRHICNPSLSRETKEEDFDTLEFKVAYLTQKIVGTINSIWGESEQHKKDMRNAMVLSLIGKTNATDNIDVPNSGDFTPLKTAAFDFYSLLYDKEELKWICDTFNHDVTEERKKNKRGAWKVRMIKY